MAYNHISIGLHADFIIYINISANNGLTHYGLATSYSNTNLGRHWQRQWYLNDTKTTLEKMLTFQWDPQWQVSEWNLNIWFNLLRLSNTYMLECWNIVNLTLRNKLQWNVNWNSYIFIQENAFENVVCKMAAILSQPQCVKHLFRDWILVGTIPLTAVFVEWVDDG